jgi:hypothetical protein
VISRGNRGCEGFVISTGPETASGKSEYAGQLAVEYVVSRGRCGLEAFVKSPAFVTTSGKSEYVELLTIEKVL